MFNFFRKKKPVLPQLTSDEIKSSLGKFFVENYYSVQSSVLDAFGFNDFYEGDSEVAAKVCVEYSVLLFEFSVSLLVHSGLDKQIDTTEIINHLYRAHLISTQEASTILTIALEDKDKYFSDESHFNDASSYYNNVQLKKTVPIHFGTFHPFIESSPLKKICNNLFDLFANHLIYFLFTDDYYISSDSPFPLIPPEDILEFSDTFTSIASFAADFLEQCSDFFKIS